MSKPTYHSHDHTFKAVLGFPEARKQLLQQHLPEVIKERIDFNSIKLEKQNFVEPDLQAKVVDILISAKLKHNKGTAYIYILFEHQSTADQNMPLRIREYNIKILKMHKKEHPKDKLPVLANLLFYHGRPSPYPYTLNIHDQFTDPELAKTYLDKTILIDIKQIPDEVLLKNAWSGLYSIFAKQSLEKKPAITLQQVSLIIKK